MRPSAPITASIVSIALATVVLAAASTAHAAEPPPALDLQALAARTAPADGQKSLADLAGRWRVVKTITIVMGTPDKPAVSKGMVTERKWVAGGRYLSDTTTGQLGGKPYWRTGLLGYNTMDKRYEWTTADNQTPILMSYRGGIGSGAARAFDMSGEFTDPGVTGEVNAGKTVAMRTQVEILDRDHHVYRLFFTPPGGSETLVDKMEFTRIR